MKALWNSGAGTITANTSVEDRSLYPFSLARLQSRFIFVTASGFSKGKEHKKYEFGNKVSILYTQTTGVIVGALAFKNEYDGHTLPDALSQYERLKGKVPENVYVDRGYKGKSKIGATNIHIPKPFSDKLSPCQQRKRRKGHKRRAAIEPIIGHLKQDHRLSKNFYTGDFGDAINVLLAAAAFNFERMMNRYKECFAHFFLQIWAIFFIDRTKADFLRGD
jgi:IS5 family transposase